MTQQELDALQGLCDGATSGPWRLGDDADIFAGNVDIAHLLNSLPDADFIAASRTAMPALIAEVRRLQTKYRYALNDYGTAVTMLAERTQERDALQKALDERNELYGRYHETERKEWGVIQRKLRDVARLYSGEKIRANAAEDDLKMVCTNGEPCAACRHCADQGPNFPCRILDAWCGGEKWEWRGPAAHDRRTKRVR